MCRQTRVKLRSIWGEKPSRVLWDRRLTVSEFISVASTETKRNEHDLRWGFLRTDSIVKVQKRFQKALLTLDVLFLTEFIFCNYSLAKYNTRDIRLAVSLIKPCLAGGYILLNSSMNKTKTILELEDCVIGLETGCSDITPACQFLGCPVLMPILWWPTGIEKSNRVIWVNAKLSWIENHLRCFRILFTMGVDGDPLFQSFKRMQKCLWSKRSPKNVNSVIYSPSCSSKQVRASFFSSTQILRNISVILCSYNERRSSCVVWSQV